MGIDGVCVGRGGGGGGGGIHCSNLMLYLLLCLALWRELILKQKGVLTDNLDISSLAKISDGYTPGHLIEVIKQVLTERRIQQVPKIIYSKDRNTFFISSTL